MPLLLFLPVCFGSQFSPYLNKIIPPILKGLADQDEEVRDTALKAGRLIVKNYAKRQLTCCFQNWRMDCLIVVIELGCRRLSLLVICYSKLQVFQVRTNLLRIRTLTRRLWKYLGKNVVTEFWHCCLFAVPMLLVLLETLLLIFGRRWLQIPQELSGNFAVTYCYCC